MQYSVEPDPCGVTVSRLYATRCSPPDMNNSHSQCHCNIIRSNLLFKTKLHSVYRARSVWSDSNKPLCSRLQCSQFSSSSEYFRQHCCHCGLCVCCYVLHRSTGDDWILYSCEEVREHALSLTLYQCQCTCMHA